MSGEYTKKVEESSQENFTYHWLELWANRKKKSMTIVNAYRKSGNLLLCRKAGLVEVCGQSLVFEACKTLADGHTKRLKAGNFCDDRLCSICNKKRAIQLLSALLLVLEEGKYCENYKVIFMTLTIRNVITIDREVYKRLMKCWKQFQEFFLLGRKYKNKGKVNYYDGPCIGGVATIETTYNQKQKEGLVWHPHMHGLLICKEYLNQKKASEYWQKITGNSMIVGFSEVKCHTQMGVVEGVIETVKYLAKLNDKMPDERIVELALALRHVRCINGFGVLKGFLVRAKKIRAERGEQKPVCRKCGGDLIEMALRWYQDRYIVHRLDVEDALKNSCCNRRNQ